MQFAAFNLGQHKEFTFFVITIVVLIYADRLDTGLSKFRESRNAWLYFKL